MPSLRGLRDSPYHRGTVCNCLQHLVSFLVVNQVTPLLICMFAGAEWKASDENFPLGLRVPPGFEVTEFADSKLANDIFSMTIDPRGRMVVSGRGFIRILADDDNDGRADRAIEFADGPADGAQGLLWEGSSLFVTGEGGLRRHRDEDGDDRADGPSELIRKIKTGGEHDAHDIKRGPDGWLYVLCGNFAGIDKSFAQLLTSPIQDPVAGCVIRFSPDLKSSEIVADGFRNAYRMDWNPDGELFTYDSDNERCVSLPWYEETRFYHVVPGGHYGWLAPQRGQFFRLPPYFPDVEAPAAYLGRGSPTGVACYRHAQFLEKYRGGFFVADWTFGRVYYLPLESAGDSFICNPEVFIEAVGENGFAPTDLVVHPQTGDLFISIGGRGTRGAVFRVSYPPGRHDIDRKEVERLQPKARLPAKPRTPLPKQGNVAMASVRELQILWGDIAARQSAGTIWEGYSLRNGTDPWKKDPKGFDAAVRNLRSSFPTGHRELDREIARTLAMIEDNDPETLIRVAMKLTPDSDPGEDIHYLAVLARLRGPRKPAVTRQAVRALLDLDRKISNRGLYRDRHWPQRVAELYLELAIRDGALNDHLLAEPAFGRPDHVLFANCPGFDRARAAKVFMKNVAEHDAFEWTPALVELVGSVTDSESLGMIRRLWEHLGLREAILQVLARQPQPEDRARFFEGLGSPQLTTVRDCLGAIEKLPPANDSAQLLALVRTVRRLQGGKEEERLREQVGKVLQSITGQKIAAADASAWTVWLEREHPELAARLGGTDGVDTATWHDRLARVAWEAGDAERGRVIYAKTGCATCHSVARATGPDLRGAASRFSRDDLFTAILLPSRDVSPRYQTTLVATANGKIHQGMIIYEAVDSLILQTGLDTTIRITNNQIVERRVGSNSLMPAGLLDQLPDSEIADLYAYLKSLR